MALTLPGRNSGRRKPAPRTDRRWILAALIVVLGAVLRLAAARGDLWLDEIWTLTLLEPVSSVGQILWGINHDNNHFLNSIYLYLLGPEASPFVQRSLSVALGTLTVAVAGLAFPRRTPEALAAMLLVAVSYPMVHYGSEARGYAGLVLFSLVALACLTRQLARPGWGARQGLGLAVCLGLLSHLFMAMTVLVLAAWAAWTVLRRTGNPDRAVGATLTAFLPALGWTAALVAVLAFGISQHGYTIGGVNPFQPMHFVYGYGGMLRFLLGVPEQVPRWLCLALALTVVAAAACLWRDRDDDRPSLYVLAVIALPAAMVGARLPNLEFCRYFLFSGTVFLLFLADLFGWAWRQGPVHRSVGAAVLLAVLAGNAGSLARFYEEGRGHYAAAVAHMAAEGPITYASDHDFRNPMLVGFFARRLGVTTHYVTRREWCRTTPDWMIFDDPAMRFAAERLSLGPAECPASFTRDRVYPAWGLSGVSWTLYRRVP